MFHFQKGWGSGFFTKSKAMFKFIQVTEKHEWEDYEEDRADEPDKKISKDFENLKIQGDLQPSAPVDPEQEKQDLLFRLSLLKRVRPLETCSRLTSLE